MPFGEKRERLSTFSCTTKIQSEGAWRCRLRFNNQDEIDRDATTMEMIQVKKSVILPLDLASLP